MVLSCAVSNIVGEAPKTWDPLSEDRMQILLIDISRAYFNAKTDDSRPTYVDLPPEANAPPGTCALLRRHMYGTQRAAEGWQDEYSSSLVAMGFVQGSASACVFMHRGKNIVLSVHGDDFTAAGPKRSLDWFEDQMKQRYELTIGGRLGPGKSDDKEATILNRVVRWTPNGIEYEADPRQGEKLLHELELDSKTNGCATPGIKPLPAQVEADGPLNEKDFTRFRAHAARGKYLSADRPDLLFSCEEICRFMSAPIELSQSALKRMAFYLRMRPRLVWKYDYQTAASLEVYTDTDWAGCIRTRKSTSGGCLLLGNHILKTWSATQASLALSSGEAEFYGVVKGAGIGLGQAALFNDVGIKIPLRVWTDSSAAIGICGRQGLGKLRHIACQTLWVQQRLRKGDFELRKVKGEVNPADIFIKHFESQARIDHLLKLFNCELREGRPSKAPELRREDVAAMCEISVAESHLPSHDPSLLPHQVAADQLDHYFPRASIAPAPLGEEDEIDDPDCLEPRAIERERPKGVAAGSRSKGQAHLCYVEEPPLSTVNASRDRTLPGNRRPGGRSRRSPCVPRRPGVASRGGRGPVPDDEPLEDVIVCNVCCGPGGVDCDRDRRDDNDADRGPVRDDGHTGGHSCVHGRDGHDTPTGNTDCPTTIMGVSRSELTSSGFGSGGSDRRPAVTSTAEAETSSAHDNVCPPDAHSRCPGDVTIVRGRVLPEGTLSGIERKGRRWMNPLAAAPEVMLGELTTSYQKSSPGLPPAEEPSRRQEPMIPDELSSSGHRDLPEPLLGNTDMKQTVIPDRREFPCGRLRRSSADVARPGTGRELNF